MNICDGNRHEEIVHEGRTCPLCEVIDIRDNLEAQIGNLQCRVKELEDEIGRLEASE